MFSDMETRISAAAIAGRRLRRPGRHVHEQHPAAASLSERQHLLIGQGTDHEAQFNPHAQYLKTAVETASPTRLVVMLYDGAIRTYSSQAMTAMQARNYRGHQITASARRRTSSPTFTRHLDYEAGGSSARQLGDCLRRPC